MKLRLHFPFLTILCVSGIPGCGGYDAADPDNIEVGTGEIAGVLVDSKGKASPDATVELIASDGTEVLVMNNMDSDGFFSVYPGNPGVYNLIGSFGDTDKVIQQGIELTEELAGINIGKIQATTVGAIGGRLEDDDGLAISGAKVEVLGTPYAKSSVDQGLFGIAGIPAGTFQVRVTKSGHITKAINITVASEQLVELGTVVLIRE